MISGCGFHHLHSIDVELIVHNLVGLCQSLLDQPISTNENVVCLKESLQVVILKTSLVTFRFLIVVSTEIAWAAILLKTLFSTVSLALLVSLHCQFREPPRFGFFGNSCNSVTTG